MAILRAGPFADVSDSFLDIDPDPDINTTADPVNCAMDNTSPRWPWRVFRIDPLSGGNYEYDTVNSNPGASYSTSFSNEGILEGDGVAWRYQAVQDFTLNGSYNCNSSGGNPGPDIRFSIRVSGITVFADSDGDDESASIGGSFSINLPAAVVPISVRILVNSENATSAFGSFQINFP
ncbi:MAG: hypothetical protein AAGJ81_10785 [Verrucomicrobiota bacterium]